MLKFIAFFILCNCAIIKWELFKWFIGICGICLLILIKRIWYFHYQDLGVKPHVIIEVRTKDECDKACSDIKKDCLKLEALGFDCEWVTEYKTRRPIALLQLATVESKCYLFRLNILKSIPNSLSEILRDQNIIKLGVQPLHDCELLLNDYQSMVCSTLDLRYLYPQNGGLKSLAASQLGIIMSKKEACSDWERYNLTNDQIFYAAMDAYVSIQLFKKWLLSKAQNLYFDYLSVYKDHASEVSKYLNLAFKPINTTHNNQSKNKIILESMLNQSHEKSNKGYAARKTPLYDNCFIHAPDGELLCSCDKKKAQWYIDKGLAEVFLNEPYSIRLLFEPAARANTTDGGRYYQQLKQNCCVVCGSSESYLRHNVVPKEYRKHFPNNMKNHQSHDIVLMCINCHQLAVKFNDSVKVRLSKICDAPILKTATTKIKYHQKVKSYARALLYSGNTIPEERKKYLKSIIQEYYKVNNLSFSLIKRAADLDLRVFNEQHESHGKKVVNYFMKDEGGLQVFEAIWRKLFLDTMKPKYLPALWSINHNHS